MKRKITCLARAGKCGFLAASGLPTVPAAAAGRTLSRLSKSSKAQVPKPNPAQRSISRREISGGPTECGWCEQQGMVAIPLIDVTEFVGVEQGETKFGERRLLRFCCISSRRQSGPPRLQERPGVLCFRSFCRPA